MDEILEFNILDNSFFEGFENLTFEDKEESEVFLQLIKADKIEAVVIPPKNNRI